MLVSALGRKIRPSPSSLLSIASISMGMSVVLLESYGNQWACKGRTLALADTIVAAAAIENHCVLMTDNRKDFPMPELDLYPLPE